MSLPLKDLGSIKVSEEAHSYLKARSDATNSDVVAIVRRMIEEHVIRELHVASLARTIHTSKGLGEIYGGEK